MTDKLTTEQLDEWGAGEIATERRNRIRVAVAAYAYEMRSDTIVSDADFDALARLIRPRMTTGNELLDAFFRREFAPHTGHWVHKHPDLAGLDRIYRALTAEPPRADGE